MAEKDILLRGEKHPFGTPTGLPLNALISQILKKYDGVYVAEGHFDPATLEVLTLLMPQHKAEGVNTISYEMPQHMLGTIKAAKSMEEVQAAYPSLGVCFNHPIKGTVDTGLTKALFDFCKATDRNGVLLLGHENNELTHMEDMFCAPRHEQGNSEEHRKKYHMAFSLEGMNGRDEWAAEYIDKHKLPGKVMVVGGFNHSKKLETSQETVWAKAYPGLNVRLGIPSIDTYALPERDDNRALRSIGRTYADKGDGADFYVKLPHSVHEEIKKLGTHSWPLQPEITGVPPAFPPVKPVGKFR